MKKAFTQTIIVFVAFNLMTAGFAMAQNVPDEASKEEAIAARKQAEVAQKQMEVAQKQMEVAQKEMETQEKKLQAQLKQLMAEQTQAKIFPSTTPPDITITATAPQVRIPAYPHSGSGAVLVIPAAELKVEDLAAITEDMSVMSRIFDTKLSQAHLTTGRGSWFIGFDPLSFGRGSGAIEAIYLEGYGALFLMNVNILLSAPPEAPEEKKTEEEDTDPVWSQMRREMYEPEEARRSRTEDRPEKKYDAEKVGNLKITLIKALKHAANIRVLKPDKSVILTVIGESGQSATSAIGRLYEEAHSRHILTTALGTKGILSSPTVLTIRAKKSDIDAFAKGQLSFDQFSQKILLLSYSYLGENAGGPSRSSLTNVIDRRGSSRSRSR